MKRRIGFVAGLIVFAVILAMPTPETFVDAAGRISSPAGAGSVVPDSIPSPEATALDTRALAASMQSVLALLVLMVVWWFTEPVPLPVTALLPAVVLPLLAVSGFTGGEVHDFTPTNALRHYANPIIFLFLGGFLMAGAMRKWKLDRRLILWILSRGTIASDPKKILLGLMASTAFFSMWISNTATTAMMLPVGLGLLAIFESGERGGSTQERSISNFATAVMLGISWSASIGGVGTLIGTPPNGIAVGILNQTFANDPAVERITFLDWMAIGVPYVAIMLPLAWMLLLRLHPVAGLRLPGEKERLLSELRSLGPIRGGERRTLAVLLTAVTLWITNPFWDAVLPPGLAGRLGWIDEYWIGLFCGVALFLVPVKFSEGRFILTWDDARYVEWGTLLLFGGGIALSDAMFRTGLAGWIAGPAVGLFAGASPLVIVAATILFVDFLTEIATNTAVTSMMVPIMITVAAESGVNPVMLAVATAVGSSLGFMLPVATAANALVYGTGRIPAGAMMKSGFRLDLLGWVVTVFIVYFVGGVLFDLF